MTIIKRTAAMQPQAGRLHYAVTKTTGTRNGRVGPYTTQEAADAAANSARDAAIAELQGEAQHMP